MSMKSFVEAAEQLDMSPRHLARMVAREVIPYVVRNGLILFEDETVERLQAEHADELQDRRGSHGDPV